MAAAPAHLLPFRDFQWLTTAITSGARVRRSRSAAICSGLAISNSSVGRSSSNIDCHLIARR